MSERHKPAVVPHEVAVTRRWIEEDIIDNGFCPPLNILARQNRGTNGQLNWEGMGAHIELTSWFDMQPDDPQLQKRLTDEYYRFVKASLTGDSVPISRIILLPDFTQNYDLEWAAYVATNDALKTIKNTDEGRTLIEAARQRPQFANLEDAGKDHPNMAGNIVNILFKPILFFGKPLGEDGRRQSPLSRDRILKRSPFNTFQVLDDHRSGLSSNIDPSKVWMSNFRRTDEIGVQAYEARMRELRGTNAA